jgi:uncharacterized membrane protein required for colicin V production
MDIALGLVVLATAIRGYLRGFVLQAIRLGGLVACVFVADPIRDYALPQLAPQFPTIAPDLLSRLTWWTAAGLSFVVITGLGGLTYRMSRHRTLGEAEPNYADQGAGFLLGAAKGLIAASVLAYACDTYALGHVKNVSWLDEHTRTSQGLAWSREYQPALKLWQTQPVQIVVAHVRRNGLPAPSSRSPVEELLNAAEIGPAETTPPPERQAKTDSPPQLKIPTRPGPQPGASDFLERFDEEMRREGIAPKDSRRS